MRRVFALALALWLLGSPSARADIDLWPFLEVSDDSTTVLYPFYVHEDEFLMVFPFYYRTNEGRDHHVVWPIAKFSEGRVKRLAPLWFSEEEDSFTLIPLVHRTPEYTLWLIPPVWQARSGEYQAVMPLYYRSQHDLWTVPWYHRSRDPGEPATDGLFPLFYSERGKDAREFSLGVFLFRSAWSPERESTLLFPLYYSAREGDTRDLWVLPYYQRRSPTRSLTGVLPLFEKDREGDRTSLMAVPYYQVRAPNENTTALFPFFRSAHRVDPADGHVHRGFSLLWPFYTRDEERDKGGRLVSRYRRFLFFSDELTPDHKRVFRMLGIAVIERTQ
jgi:hypothetical protein